MINIAMIFYVNIFLNFSAVSGKITHLLKHCTVVTTFLWLVLKKRHSFFSPHCLFIIYSLYFLWNLEKHDAPSPELTLSVTLNFCNNKKWFYCIFYQINNQFLHQSYLKAHSQSNQLDKKCKKSFFISEKIQKYLKCPRGFLPWRRWWHFLIAVQETLRDAAQDDGFCTTWRAVLARKAPRAVWNGSNHRWRRDPEAGF